MRLATMRRVLERVYGFAEPTAIGDGIVTYECAYCGARDDDRAPQHTADCWYWQALWIFETPAARRLVEQFLGAA